MAVEWTSETGEVHQFSLDEGKLIALEDAGDSLFELMERITTSIRFKDLYTAADLMDLDYRTFCGMGYNVQQLVEIVAKCLEELGFTSEMLAGNTSA